MLPLQGEKDLHSKSEGFLIFISEMYDPLSAKPGRLVETCQDTSCYYFKSNIFFEISFLPVFSL